MNSELAGETDLHGEHSGWALGEWSHLQAPSLAYHFLSDFRQRSFKKLEHLGDTAVDAQRYDEAISRYSIALSLDSPSPLGILIKRSKARVATGSWKQALDDANQVHRFYFMGVNLVHPSSSSGHHTRPGITMGLREEACSFALRRTVRRCHSHTRDDALEDFAVT